jgi:hypothetical protein
MMGREDFSCLMPKNTKSANYLECRENQKKSFWFVGNPNKNVSKSILYCCNKKY